MEGGTRTKETYGEKELEIKFLNPGITKEKLVAAGAKETGHSDIIDTYYRSRYDGKIFRIRNENSISYLMHKSEDISTDTTKNRTEYSSRVGGDILPIIEQLGLEERVTAYKRRTKFQYEDLHIDFDQTDYAGTILEVEYTSRETLLKFIAKLGLAESTGEKRDNYQLMCEKKLGEFSIVETAIDEIAKRISGIGERTKKRPIVIGVSGASGSGKTHVSGLIAGRVGGTLLSLDRYYVEDANEIAASMGGNFDHPSLIDFPLIKKHLAALGNGQSIDVPIYSFKSGLREGYERFVPSDIIVIEGIFALHPMAVGTGAGTYDLTVAIQSTAHLNLLRRLCRDAQRTSRTDYQTLNQISTTTFPSFKAYVEPYLKGADIKISSAFDPRGASTPKFQVKLKNPDFKMIKERLGPMLRHIRRVKQSDTILLLDGVNDASEIVKVRLQDDGTKPLLAFNAETEEGNTRKRRSYECRVGEDALRNLAMLGYRTVGRVEKERDEYRFGDAIVRFDSIEGLGDFMEIEASEESSVNAVLAALGNLASETTKDSYAKMIRHS